MKRFSFQFETVLQVREQEEQKKQSELAEHESELKELEEQIEDLRGAYRKAQEEMRKLQSGSISVEYIRIVKNRLNGLTNEMSKKMELYKEKRRKVEEVRRELVEASRRKRAMEILKEQEWEEYLEEYRKEEQKFLDDVNSSRQAIENEEPLNR